MVETCIVVVLYYPSAKIFKQFDELAKDFFVLLIDNTPEGKDITISAKVRNACYIPLCENKGIAYAQNIGIKKAFDQGADFILFFDQDSDINNVFVNRMIKCMKELMFKDYYVGALGPIIVDKDSGDDYKHAHLSGGYTRVQTIISSGSIATSRALKEVGMMEEDLFIDLVDHEWCWRAENMGWHIYMTSKVCLPHKVGERTVKVFGIPFIRCKPIRYFYKIRNAIWLNRRTYVPVSWKIKNTIKMLFNIICLPVINPKNTLQCYKKIFKGIKVGLFK